MTGKENCKPYTRQEAQSRFDKQAAFCAAGGTPPWKNSQGKWMKDGKDVGDPAGPFTPGNPQSDKKGR